jgi:PKD repeat protein
MLYSTSITSQVVSDFTTISSNTGCGSLVVEFQDLSTGSPDTWSWDFGNGNVSNLQNPIAVYTDPGVYTVKLTVSDLNSYDDKTMVDLIEVYHNPSSSFNQNLTEVCATSLINFSDQSISNSNIINWMWDFGDGGNSNLEDPVYQYNNSGIYTVSLSIEDDKGCQDIIVMNDLIDVKSIPDADFTSDINISCDTNKIINFTNS